MNVYLVNTNSKLSNHNPNGYSYMLWQNRVMTYYRNSSQTQVDLISKGDLILLYHNENRIIAVGFAVSGVQTNDYEDIGYVEHFVNVNWIWKALFNGNIPQNSINRNDIGITMVNGAVVNVTNQINFKALLENIASRQ